MQKNYLPLNLAKPIDRIVLNNQPENYYFNPAFAQLNSSRFLLAYRVKKDIETWRPESSQIHVVLMDEKCNRINHDIPPISNA